MQNEYNDLVLLNDELPKNALGCKISLKNDAAICETANVSELSEKIIEESGSTRTAGTASKSAFGKSATIQKLSSAASSVTVTAGAATVVAAVVVVVMATSSGAVMPGASVTGANVSYYNGSEIRVEFLLEDEEDELESFYAWIEDGDTEITCEITAGEGAYYADAVIAQQSSGELYFVVYGSSNGGWSGELYRGILALPTAPDIGVEYTAEYVAESGELTISYEIYDENSQLSGYTARIYYGNSEIESAVDYAARTVTATVTDTENLYFVIDGEAVSGWAGEIFRDMVEISADTQTTDPTAPDITVSEVWDEGWYEEGGEMYMYVYFTGDASNVTFSYWFEDDYGNIIVCEFVEETEEYVCVYASFDGSIDFTLDERGRLSFVISATTADGWTGEIYREKFVIDPVAPDVEVTDVTVTSYSYGTTLTVQFTVEDLDGEIASYEAWYSDYVGYSDCTLTQDGYTFTATADVSGLDTSGNLAFYIFCVTNDGWSGDLYSGNLILPTAPDLTAEVYVDSIMYSDGVVYVNVYYTGDTSVISAYEYWFEDEDGNKFVYDLGEVADGAVYGTTTLSPSDNPVLDTYGRMDFVIAVTTTDGWTGEIHREKYEISSNGYLTYPELTGVTINYYETDIYTEMQISVDDPDYVLTALYITLTDANTTLDLTGGELSVEIGYETDADGITTYYIYLYDTTITPLEDGTVKVYLLADLTVDDITTDAVLADAYYTVTVN